MTRSWQDKFDSSRETYQKVNDKRFADLEAGTAVLIPSPADIAAEIDRLDAGQRIDLTELRDRLAERHGADGSCPVMTGMNLRIVTEVALEALEAGEPGSETTPVWRAIADNSSLAKKLGDRYTTLREAAAEHG